MISPRPQRRARRTGPTGPAAAPAAPSEVDWRWGIHPVQEAIRAGRATRVWLAGEPPGRGRLATLGQQAAQAEVPVTWVTREAVAQLAPGRRHQDAVARVAPLPAITVSELVQTAQHAGHDPLLLVLDQVQDPQNVGAILRTADAVAVDGVVVPERRAAPLGGTVSRASAGALEHLTFAPATNIAAALDQLKALGFWIYGLDPRGPTTYDAADYRRPVALVVGSEGPGLRRLVAAKCDMLLRLPLLGHVESLNVAVATSVCLYHATYRRQQDGREAHHRTADRVGRA